MNRRCVDAAYYWTPEEAGAIVDYLDRLRDSVWEIYSDDIIDCRTPEPDEPEDPRQRHLRFDDEISRIDEGYAQAFTPWNRRGKSTQRSAVMNDKPTAREALPSLDNLPSLSDENIGNMLDLLRALLGACEEHYTDPIRRLDKQRQRELSHRWMRDRPTSSTTDWDDDF